MGFVGNYVPCGLSPQTDGMPVIHKKSPAHETMRGPVYCKAALRGGPVRTECSRAITTCHYFQYNHYLICFHRRENKIFPSDIVHNAQLHYNTCMNVKYF